MSFHLITSALLVSVCLAVVFAFRVGLLGKPKTPTPTTPVISNSARSERVVVMATAGGQLEIAAVHVRETFTRSDSKVLFDFLDLGTTMSEVRVDATYRFHVAMKTHWPLRIAGRTCLVRAGPVRPTLPVAFDSATVERRTSSGWARFDKAENLRALEASLTQQLAERAPLYREQAQEAGRAVVETFVLEWLIKEQHWKRDSEHRVVVVFDDES